MRYTGFTPPSGKPRRSGRVVICHLREAFEPTESGQDRCEVLRTAGGRRLERGVVSEDLSEQRRRGLVRQRSLFIDQDGASERVSRISCGEDRASRLVREDDPSRGQRDLFVEHRGLSDQRRYAGTPRTCGSSGTFPRWLFVSAAELGYASPLDNPRTPGWSE